MFTVIFAIPRTAGWVAQWLEMIDDSEQKIARPRQIYTGERGRDYVAIDGSRGAGERSSGRRRGGRSGLGAGPELEALEPAGSGVPAAASSGAGLFASGCSGIR